MSELKKMGIGRVALKPEKESTGSVVIPSHLADKNQCGVVVNVGLLPDGIEVLAGDVWYYDPSRVQEITVSGNLYAIVDVHSLLFSI